MAYPVQQRYQQRVGPRETQGRAQSNPESIRRGRLQPGEAQPHSGGQQPQQQRSENRQDEKRASCFGSKPGPGRA